nr:ninjurin-2-like isoform X2 [Dermatophagoides farinae]
MNLPNDDNNHHNNQNKTYAVTITENYRKAPLADEETASDLNGNGNNGSGGGGGVIDIIDLKQSSSSHQSNHNRTPIMDMNMYATRKTIAQGIMDLGLMCANASQLKYVLINANHHRYFQVTVSLIVISILMQIIVGIMFIALGRLNINYGHDRRRADMMNNASVIVIFLVTVINVLITAFGPSETIQSSSSSLLSSPSTAIYHHGSILNSDHQSPSALKLTSWTNLYPDSKSND